MIHTHCCTASPRPKRFPRNAYRLRYANRGHGSIQVPRKHKSTKKHKPMKPSYCGCQRQPPSRPTQTPPSQASTPCTRMCAQTAMHRPRLRNRMYARTSTRTCLPPARPCVSALRIPPSCSFAHAPSPEALDACSRHPGLPAPAGLAWHVSHRRGPRAAVPLPDLPAKRRPRREFHRHNTPPSPATPTRRRDWKCHGQCARAAVWTWVGGWVGGGDGARALGQVCRSRSAARWLDRQLAQSRMAEPTPPRGNHHGGLERVEGRGVNVGGEAPEARLPIRTGWRRPPTGPSHATPAPCSAP